MADPRQVEAVYRRVIDDTVTKLTPEFENLGVSMQVLYRLQEVWTAAMVNAMRPPIPDSSSVPSSYPTTVSRAPSGGKASSSSSNSTHALPSSITAPQAAVSSSSTSGPSGTEDSDSLRYTITEPMPYIKSEGDSEENKLATIESSASASGMPDADKSTTATTNGTGGASSEKSIVPKQEEDSESSDVSDEDDIDTSTWTNSLMSMYQEPTKRVKTKRTFQLLKGILNVDGRDYLFSSGKAEFDWN